MEKDKKKKLKLKKEDRHVAPRNHIDVPDISLIVELKQMQEVIAQLQDDKHVKDENIKKLAEQIDNLQKTTSPFRQTTQKGLAENKMNGKTTSESANKLGRGMYYCLSADSSPQAIKDFFSNNGRKKTHKEQISRALRLLKDQKNHPEKYDKDANVSIEVKNQDKPEKEITVLKAVKDEPVDDDADVLTAAVFM